MAGEDNKDFEDDGAPLNAAVPSGAGNPAEGPAGSGKDSDRPAASPDALPDALPGEQSAVGPEPEDYAPVPEHHKANTLNRLIARFIDILVTLLLAKLPGNVGPLAGLTYIAVADGLVGGRSIGKRVIGLKVLKSKDGKPADFRASILRNSTIGLLYILYLIPFIGWVLAVVGFGLETLIIIGSPEGKRLGDEIASTVVQDDPAATT